MLVEGPPVTVEDLLIPVEVTFLSDQEEDVPAELPSLTVEDLTSISGQEGDVPDKPVENSVSRL